MPHQKQCLQNIVWRTDPIYHTPLSLTDSSCLSAWCLLTCWWSWLNLQAQQKTMDPRHLRCSQGGENASGWVCCGSSSCMALPAKGSLPTHTQRLKYFSTIFHSPYPASPNNFGKQLLSQWDRVMGFSECWLSQSVFVPPANQCLDHMRYFWSFQKPEMQNSELISFQY